MMDDQTEQFDIDALDRAARLAMTAEELAAYASACRWGVPPVGGPYHHLVRSAAMDRPGGFRVWPSLEDYAAAGAEVRARLASVAL